jgi:hypothetical protein
MTCIKTGCAIHIEEYNVYAWCDAHDLGGAYVFRISFETFDPKELRAPASYIVREIDEWFDRGKNPSTLISTIDGVVQV